ncbi:eCIS core domain-containing protein [Natranaeroarchaeum aerophilus]|uniref:DUF4157 domain-containing protein n=1 Tax=Natranaeroarchaeum aerophilus TaxID=2917711 RepID=A0AAE3FMK0_9EURY|nr:DUF4157 domain-containing protein [Natranaeroarchaeum aerophilus]MCL9812049.1 DUF4157 domain-containing protein [Natranaeroarchaeum aerophilus]
MEEHRIQRATEGTTSDPEDIPEPVLDVVGGEGMPLEGSIQRSLEDRMDADFSDVRIHTGADATKACEAIDARAFTCGNKIAFNAGEYNPESPEGQYLLAHELAHVKQQTGGAAISMMPKEGGLQIDPDPQLEREADEMAAQALSGEEPLVVNRMGADVHIQRAAKGESMAYEGLDNLTEEVANLRETVAENQQEIQDTKSSLGALEDEVHGGLGETAAGIAGAGLGAGAIALGRAGMEPAMQDGLANTAMNPELAAPAMAATLMAASVGAAGAGAKGLWDRAKERFFGDETDEEEQFEEEERDGLLSSIKERAS